MIVSKEIEEYKKYAGTVDLIALREKLGIPFHDKQAEIAELFTGDKRKQWWYMTVLCSRRFGKTDLGRGIALGELMTPYARVAILTPDLSLATEEFFTKISNTLLSNPDLKDHVKISKSDMTIEILPLNSALKIASETTYEGRILGRNVTTLIFDEGFVFKNLNTKKILEAVVPAGANYGTYEDTLIPIFKWVTLSTPRGHLKGTECGVRYWYGMSGEKGYISKKFTVYDSPFLKPHEIEALRAATPPSTFNREFMCEFDTDDTGVYHRFTHEANVFELDLEDLKARKDRLMYISSSDIGMSDGNGFLVKLYDTKTEEIFVVDEHYKKGELFSEYIKVVKEKEKYWAETIGFDPKNKVRYIDPSAAAAKAEALRDHSIFFANAANEREKGFDTVNTLFETGKLKIASHLKETLRQVMFAEFRAVSGGNSNLYAIDASHGTHYELCDCLRYGVYSGKLFFRKALVI